MAHPGDPNVIHQRIIMLDDRGEITEDKDRAVSGEVIETLADGTTRSTLFTVDPARAAD